MRYLNLLLILVVIGCYSGVHTSNFNLTNEATPSCHSNSGIEKVHHKTSPLNIQIKFDKELQSCCIDTVTYRIDYKSISQILTASIIDYYDLHYDIQNKDNFRDNNLKNHSPPKLFISQSSFLI